MDKQTIQNLEFAITQWGKQDREYRIMFTASGTTIGVYALDGLRWKLIEEVWGKFQYHGMTK